MRRRLRTTLQTDYKPETSSPLARHVWHIDDPPSPSSPVTPTYGLGLTLRSHLPPRRPKMKIRIPKPTRPELGREDADLDPDLLENEGDGVKRRDSAFALEGQVSGQGGDRGAEAGAYSQRELEQFAESFELPGGEQVHQSIETEAGGHSYGGGPRGLPVDEQALQALQSFRTETGGYAFPGHREQVNDAPNDTSEVEDTIRDDLRSSQPLDNSTTYPDLEAVVSDNDTPSYQHGTEQSLLGGQAKIAEARATQAAHPQNMVERATLSRDQAQNSTPPAQTSLPCTGSSEDGTEEIVVDEHSWSGDLDHVPSDASAARPSQRVILQARSPRRNSRSQRRGVTHGMTTHEQDVSEVEGESSIVSSHATAAASADTSEDTVPAGMDGGVLSGIAAAALDGSGANQL